MHILSVDTAIKISKTYIDKASNTLWVNSTYPLSAKLLKLLTVCCGFNISSIFSKDARAKDLLCDMPVV